MAYVIPVRGVIDAYFQQSLFRRLEVAWSKGATIVILEIDSPGGHLEESLAIAHHLNDLDWAKTVAWVPKEALSGASLISLGCDEIAMHPTARLGDCGAIVFGEDSMFHYAPEKITSDLVAQARQLAQANGKPPTLAEAMIDKDVEVFVVRNRTTGEELYLSEAELRGARDPDVLERLHLVPESLKGRFLEVSGTRAAELRLAVAAVESEADLWKRYELDQPPAVLAESWVDRTVYILTRPWMTVILFVVGVVGLLIELYSPGIAVAGVTSALCFALFFWSRFLGGTADVLEIVLFVVGAALLALELFVIPGFGVTGVVGILLMLAGIVLACQTVLLPRTEADVRTLATTMGVLVVSMIISGGAALVMSRYFGALPLFKHLVLVPPPAAATAATGPNDAVPAGDGRQSLLGQTGIAATPLVPAGKARFGDRQYDVLTDGDFIDAGTNVKVVSIQGNRMFVRREKE